MGNRNHRAGAAAAATGQLLAWTVAFLASWLLWTNPGYFSHDELQWAAFAGTAGPVHWVPWLDAAAFQYRPLTFNLWLCLSRGLFDTPQLFHALLVAWGSANAALLFALGRRLGVAAWPAFAGALLFALGPYAAYVHGWVGTIADLAWVGCALLAGLLATADVRAWVLVCGTMLLTAVALLAKEAAVVIPAVFAVGWICLVGAAEAAKGVTGEVARGFRRSNMLVAAGASGLVVAGYLALRLPVLLHAPDGAAPYQLSAAVAPRHWLADQLFAFMPSRFEVATTRERGLHGTTVLAGLLWLGVVAACWRAHWRLAACFLLGGVAMLLPVLPIAGASNQYGYGFAALATMGAAAAWPRVSRGWRAALVLAAVACLWHGFNVMRTMRHVGEVQAVFSPALADAVRADRQPPLRLRVTADAEPWIFRRLTHEIPSYQGVPIGDRVRLVPGGAQADAEIARGGQVIPL